MVLFDQNNFGLSKRGLHMVDTWYPNSTLMSRVCFDVTARALAREHGELFFSVLLYIDRKQIFRQAEPEFAVVASNSYSCLNFPNIVLTKCGRIGLP